MILVAKRTDLCTSCCCNSARQNVKIRDIEDTTHCRIRHTIYSGVARLLPIFPYFYLFVCWCCLQYVVWLPFDVTIYGSMVSPIRLSSYCFIWMMCVVVPMLEHLFCPSVLHQLWSSCEYFSIRLTRINEVF